MSTVSTDPRTISVNHERYAIDAQCENDLREKSSNKAGSVSELGPMVFEGTDQRDCVVREDGTNDEVCVGMEVEARSGGRRA